MLLKEGFGEMVILVKKKIKMKMKRRRYKSDEGSWGEEDGVPQSLTAGAAAP